MWSVSNYGINLPDLTRIISYRDRENLAYRINADKIPTSRLYALYLHIILAGGYCITPIVMRTAFFFSAAIIFDPRRWYRNRIYMYLYPFGIYICRQAFNSELIYGGKNLIRESKDEKHTELNRFNGRGL